MKHLPLYVAAIVFGAVAAARADLVCTPPAADPRTAAPAAGGHAVHTADLPAAIVLDRSLLPAREGALLPLDLVGDGLASSMHGLRASAGLPPGWTSPLASRADLPATSAGDRIIPAPPEIRSLPPGGDTDALCLSGLLSLGAFQLARRPRHVQFGVPDWYHAEVRLQAGHAFAFDMQSTHRVACDAVQFSDPAPPARAYRNPLALPSITFSESCMRIQAPRAPPVTC